MAYKELNEESFSKRHRFYGPTEIEISVRHDAPYEFRGVLINLAYECGYSPSSLRSLVCTILKKRPDRNNWSGYPNIDGEVHQLIDNCEWYRVYDIAEGIYASMEKEPYSYKIEKYQKELNGYLIENGIGWQLKDGRIETRGTESFEAVVDNAKNALEETRRLTANNEIHEAVLDLSRRPKPDITGAIQHSMASLECVARDVCGDQNATLGDILKRYSGLIPPPLDEAVKKAWGYASENARHIREGKEPDYEEAELLVGMCASLTTYLVKKNKA